MAFGTNDLPSLSVLHVNARVILLCIFYYVLGVQESSSQPRSSPSHVQCPAGVAMA